MTAPASWVIITLHLGNSGGHHAAVLKTAVAGRPGNIGTRLGRGTDRSRTGRRIDRGADPLEGQGT